MIKRIFGLICCLSSLALGCFTSDIFGLEYKDGVYVSSPNRTDAYRSVVVKQGSVPESPSRRIPQNLDDFVKEYINQVVIKHVISNSQDLLRLAIENTGIQLFPQIVNLSMQQIVLECFNQEATRKVIEDAFTQAVDIANKDLEEEEGNSKIKADIEQAVHNVISPITDNPVYKKIFEHVFKEAQKQQQKMIMMQVAQRQAQLGAIQQRYQMMQQVVQKQYQAILEEFMKQYLAKYMESQMKQQMQFQPGF